ncbi:LOW QUALITY PROTEIN: hypothetical protein PHMEG_00027647 [Phytophthora megakarya]|uniref:Uncharacterized protein n=1 Tax=Phytophthora megakarya TaxID=4795 RepID=A0A225V6G4_9STRA|nr:LOW QUALITY PROTEIN: hypothetical protein PHMEG_00027647 [Phytophthora megakarya]
MSDLQATHDQLAGLHDLAENDLNEADILLTHLASHMRESQAMRMPKRERNPPSSPPQLPSHKAPRSDRPFSPPPNRDQSEIEGQEHQDQPEFEGLDDQELEEKPETPSGGGGSPGDHDSPPPDHGPTPPPPSPSPGRRPTTPPPSPPRSPGGSPGGGSPGGDSPIQLHPPFFPADPWIPHYSTHSAATEIYPWDPTIVGTVPIIAMIQATVTKRMPVPASFLFPYRVPPVRAPIPVVGYLSGLITGANVLALMATEPWRMLGRRRPTPLTFDHNFHRRAQTPLSCPLEEDHMIAYWESTHYLEITSAMTDADSDLFTYHQDRRQRRIRAGETDIDLLLNPYFLHLPTKQDRVRWYHGSVSRAANLAQPSANLPDPADLIMALFECDQAGPWRNYYRDPGSVHPSRNIPRLVNKFNPPAAPPAAP